MAPYSDMKIQNISCITDPRGQLFGVFYILLQTAAWILLSSHLRRPGPWSRTCRSRSGKADLVVASELTGWKTTTPARRCWPSGRGSPRWLLLSALSLSLSGRWPATAGRHRPHYSLALFHSYFYFQIIEYLENTLSGKNENKYIYKKVETTERYNQWVQ